jgi:hypothetical protein
MASIKHIKDQEAMTPKVVTPRTSFFFNPWQLQREKAPMAGQHNRDIKRKAAADRRTWASILKIKLIKQKTQNENVC